MKKVNTALICALISISAFVPLCIIVANAIGYNFELWNYSTAAIIITAIFAISDIFLTVTIKSDVYKFARVLTATAPFFGLFNLLFYLVKTRDGWITALMILFFLHTTYLSCITAKKLWFKIVYMVLCGLLIFPLCFICFVSFLFKGFGANTVVQTVESPSGTYRAEVIDSDHGATGGATYVNVYGQDKTCNFYFFEFSRYPIRVYNGDWGDFMDMQIEWVDDHTLYINGKKNIID